MPIFAGDPGATAPNFTSPATTSHVDVVPYISCQEFIEEPTAVDVTELTPGATAAVNLQQLANVIARASGWANTICGQILAATPDTQMASRLYVRRDGTVWVPCDFWPIRQVDSFLAGPTPSTLAAVTGTADIWLAGDKVLVVPVFGISPSGPSPMPFGGIQPGTRVYARWTYWNGWFHSTLAGAVAAGAVTLPLTTALPASAAGATMTIVDSALEETVQVASTFTGGTALPLAAPCVNAHTPGALPNSITVTELPPNVRQAVVNLTSALIKVRGTEAEVMEDVGQQPSKTALIESGGLDDYQVAVDLLDRYQRTV